MKAPYTVFIGWDAAEMRAWNVASLSLRTKSPARTDVRRLALLEMQARGLYLRPTRETAAGLWDVISDAPMSTGHAIARFLVPYLCDYAGWAVFTDGDVLFRQDIGQLFALADPQYAVQVVQHDYRPTQTEKMVGQIQTTYPRKNWSSVILWNAGHPANLALTLGMVNALPGRDLHRFCWLDDALIGALPPEWNWLAGHSSADIDPAIVHFTEGVPDMPGYEHAPYADEWYRVARSVGYHLTRPALEVTA